VEFHLIYYGEHLKAARRASARPWEKHQIRLELHRQLRVLWETHPLLRFYTEESHWQVGGMMHFATAHKAKKAAQ